ncbi:glucoamylase family protein [Aurantiacibacter spongiae]|uniref:Tat pathway signal protein n=1 Tax=Aurantiacibacter spongiae TaxID=2488860 RepID=A0A3N5CZL4_9SPHN|nr:glucoamylase family protein [Aurantiacibacter spongiae]RPF72169.1 Tat pathway signal protein [Aurantiacibacter spongiae]
MRLAMLAGCMVAACVPAPAPAPPVVPPAGKMSNAAVGRFSEDLTRRTFRYFWDTTDTERCLAPDRWPTRSFSSVAATGFALTAYGIGAHRGYVSRDEAARRTRDCLAFYWNAPQGPGRRGITGYRGFFYHFLRYEDGTRFGETELSTVDTTLFLGGALFAQGYYDRDDPVEAQIRDLAERIYRRVEWDWAQRPATGTQADNLANSQGITMGWRPERGWEPHDWVGYNEGMLVYILALASPTHPVGKEAWNEGWADTLENQWATYYGYDYLQFEPLFGHQYSHVWIDFRGIRDDFMREKNIDYFENSRRATLAQRAYGADNPNRWVGYDDAVWGWTASDGPAHSTGEYMVNGRPREFFTYRARGVSAFRVVDDGTIVPTAAGGSIPFAPRETIAALMTMKQRYGDRLYDEYGFRDAFNPSFTFVEAGSPSGTVDPASGWVAGDHLGIDQGPILAMMENHRSGLVWATMRRHPHVREGLKRAGFSGGWLDEPAP